MMKKSNPEVRFARDRIASRRSEPPRRLGSSLGVFLLLASLGDPLSAAAQGTAFTYQGRLLDAGVPANGIYDLRFTIYDALLAGGVVAGPLTNSAAAVSNGFFTVSLDFGQGVFAGADRWLEIGVRTNSGGAFTTLNSRQQLTPVPYALYAAGAGTANGVTPGSITGASIVPGSITAADIAGGQVLTSINGYSDAITLSSGPNIGISAAGNNLQISALGLWTVNGNSGASPTNGNFIGTTDLQPLELKAGGIRVLRLEPDLRAGGGAGNLIGGFTNNLIEQPGSGGDIIAGGGYAAGPNVIHSNSSGVFIGAGSANQVGPGVNDVVIGGGFGNSIQSGDSVVGGGVGNAIQSSDAVIGGGYSNAIPINASYSVIGGGAQNKVQTNATFATPFATIGGGQANTVGAQNGTIGGGYVNTVSGNFGTVAGGLFNTASGSESTVLGGSGNVAGGFLSMAGGWSAHAIHDGSFVWADPSSGLVFGSTTSNQFSVRATGGVRFVTGGAGMTVDGAPVFAPAFTATDSNHSNIVNVVEGSSANFAAGGLYGATISGGGGSNYNGFYVPNVVTADFGTVGGGEHNTSSGAGATIAGGNQNTIQDFATSAAIGGGQQNTNSGAYGTIGGGFGNAVSISYATVGGGNQNNAGGLSAAVGGGALNSASGFWGTVGGGAVNISSGSYSTVPGGYSNNAAGQFSFAAGQRANATHDGTFVWADSGNADFASTSSNQFLVRAGGGVAINTNDPAGAALNVAGTVRAAAFQGDGSGLVNVSSGAFGDYVFAYTSSAQSVTTGSVFQDAVLNVDAQINGWNHTPGTAPYTSSQAGLYLIQYNAEVNSNNGNGTNATLRLTLNSAEITGSRTAVTVTALNQLISVSKSVIASVNASDVLTVQFTGSGTGIRLTGTPGVSLTITRIQ